jgi:hypothetical protein
MGDANINARRNLRFAGSPGEDSTGRSSLIQNVPRWKIPEIRGIREGFVRIGYKIMTDNLTGDIIGTWPR